MRGKRLQRERYMKDSIFLPADILIPAGTDLEKWSVIACDQFSSEPDYWERVRSAVGECPSTLRLMIPEAYLEQMKTDEVIGQIGANMERYLSGGIFRTVHDAFIYVERTTTDGRLRRGLVGMVDLDAYDFSADTEAKIRASEQTILSRLPPRIKIREQAVLELPHIMTLIDDRGKTVIEPLAAETDRLEKLYDFDLMEGGGHITGFGVSGRDAEAVQRRMESLSRDAGAAMIVGDGNHSLAAAKGLWEKKKAVLSAAERENHPARYSLVEVNNVYDEAIDFEAIHRVAFCVEPERLLAELKSIPQGGARPFLIRCVWRGGAETIGLSAGSIGEMIGILQTFLDTYTEQNGGSVDYIHGEDSVRALSKKDGCLGFILPAMKKSDFFATVTAGGVFPRKSFSIGHARDKRYYLECRKIK